MNTYQYQVLRYMPDRLSGEFINLGVVVFDAAAQSLHHHFHAKSGRLYHFFPEVSSRFVSQSVEWIEAGLHRVGEQLQKPLRYEGYEALDDITRQVLPKDDSSLYFTDAQKVLDVDAGMLAQELYDRVVMLHIHEPERESIQDAEVWSKVYKQYFDQYHLTEVLQPATIQTPLFTHNFDKTCRNGVLHCFEAVSFQLSTTEYIKRKALLGAGRIDELKGAEEELRLYLLAALPDDRALARILREKFARVSSGKVTVELVDTRKAEAVVKEVKHAMETHEG